MQAADVMRREARALGAVSLAYVDVRGGRSVHRARALLLDGLQRPIVEAGPSTRDPGTRDVRRRPALLFSSPRHISLHSPRTFRYRHTSDRDASAEGASDCGRMGSASMSAQDMTFAELVSATATVAGGGPPGDWFRASAVGRVFAAQFDAQRAVIVRAPAESMAIGRLIEEQRCCMRRCSRMARRSPTRAIRAERVLFREMPRGNAGGRQR